MSIEFNKQYFLQGNENDIVSTVQKSSLIQEKLLGIEELIYLNKYDQAKFELDSMDKNNIITKKEQKILLLLLKSLCLTHPRDEQTAFKLIDTAEEVLIHIKNSTIPLHGESIIFLYSKGQVCYNFQKFDEGLVLFDQCIHESIIIANKFYQARALNKQAKIFFEKELFDQAFEVTMKALAISTANNYLFEIVQGYEMLGLLNQNKNKTQSLKYFEYSLKISMNQLKNDVLIAKAFLNIGKTKLLQKELDKAQHYFQESLNFYSKAAYQSDNPIIFKNLGDIYARRGNYTESLDYYKNSLELSLNFGKLKQQGQILFAIGSVYFRTRDFKNALKYYLESLEIKRTSSNTIDLAGPLWGIGHVYFIKHNYSKAMNYYLELYEVYKTFGKPEYISEVLLIIITLKVSIGDEEEIKKYLLLLKQIAINNSSIHTNLAFFIAKALTIDETRLNIFDEKLSLFEKAKDNLSINPHFSYFSLLHIILIHLKEFSLTQEDEILDDIIDEIIILKDFASVNYNYPLELFSNLALILLNYIQNNKQENASLLVKITVTLEQIKIKSIETEITNNLKKIDRLDKKISMKSLVLTKNDMIDKLGIIKFINKVIDEKFWL